MSMPREMRMLDVCDSLATYCVSLHASFPRMSMSEHNTTWPGAETRSEMG